MVVLLDTKIQIWKQFTTVVLKVTLLLGCITRYKDTNLKAIHNKLVVNVRKSTVVLLDTKIQIWKQFTTTTIWLFSLLCCITRYKDTNLKAIHNRWLWRSSRIRVVLLDTKIQIWKQFTTMRANDAVEYSCITRYKDTNLKAIHNLYHMFTHIHLVVLLDTKIQIWKQFTTPKVSPQSSARLYY